MITSVGRTLLSSERLYFMPRTRPETARLTVVRPELDEQEQWAINDRLAYIADHIHEQPEISIKYFVPDERKSGGAIVEFCGKVKKVSAADGTIVMADGCKVQIVGIVEISYTNC